MNDLATPALAVNDCAMTEPQMDVPATDRPDAPARDRGKPSSAFRRRLTTALALLAAVAAIQGALALWAVWVAERHVLRGRVAAEIQLGFFTLASNKQRLRNWVAERQFGVSADDGYRDMLLADMRETLVRLDLLAAHAVALDGSPSARRRQAQRSDSLKVLETNLMQMARGLATPWTLPDGADAASAWVAATRLFDEAEGRDLRVLLADSLEREDEAVQEKRAETDRTLGWMRLLWIGSTTALILAALLLAWHFARALNRPLLSLSTGAQALREGRLAHRIAIDGADEFAEVARSMNAMAGELAEHRRREIEARQALEGRVAARTTELTAALGALQQADARRRQLFADISHELRTPTTAIRGEAQVTLRGCDKPIDEYKASLQRIADTARQLGLVIDDLLTMARSDMESLSLRRVPIELADVLGEVISHGETMARAGQVILTHEPWPDGLPMSGDAVRLRQLFLALVDNAVRYSRPGGRIRLSARRIERQGPWIEVHVQDEGIGIDALDLALVFERNHRSSRARSHSPEGNGLGLSIARLLAHRHGGDIALTSVPGQGTTATVTLPLAADDDRGAA